MTKFSEEWKKQEIARKQKEIAAVMVDKVLPVPVDRRMYDDIRLHRLDGRLSLEIGGYWYQLSPEQEKQFREALRELNIK